VLMIVFGFTFFSFGLWQLRTPLWLLVFGDHATAEATDVVKIKAGLPDLILHSDAEIQANLETRDRSYVFWNDFTFRTPEGATVKVRAPVGSQLKPLYPLFDSDGLPTTDPVYYDPRRPELVVFPDIISTWFAPGLLIFAGLLTALIGSFLYYWAEKTIELPHVPTSPPTEGI
jgi:hypothetical protein